MGKYNYKLAKWLSKKLKPLSVNEHTISDIFLSADELQEMEINEHDLLVFMMYLQSSLMFLWMKSSRALPKEPLKITGSAKNTVSTSRSRICKLPPNIFQFEGNLYQQVDGNAMGLLLGPLTANTFMCNEEKQLETKNKMLEVYKCYVDDMLSVMTDVKTYSF